MESETGPTIVADTTRMSDLTNWLDKWGELEPLDDK